MSKQKNILFLSPIIPNTTGNGLAMRAGAILEALAKDHNVHLLVIPIADPNNPESIPDTIQEHCSSFYLSSIDLASRLLSHLPSTKRKQPHEWLYTSTKMVNNTAEFFNQIPFDHIHIFRLYLYPFAEPYIQKNPSAKTHLDLDDIESQSRQRSAALHPENQQLSREAAQYLALENSILAHCDKIYVCSKMDQELLSQRFEEKPALVPNTVRIPSPAEALETHDPFTFLFIGNLNHVPNREALLYFTTEILPCIRQKTEQSFKVKIAGRGHPKLLEPFLKEQEIGALGYVEEVNEAYVQSDALIAPLLSGGGTRIKILESFAHKTPVVATPIGAEGIEANNGEHLLLADNSENFAKHCVKLMEDSQYGKELAAAAYKQVTACYSQEILNKIIHDLTATDSSC